MKTGAHGVVVEAFREKNESKCGLANHLSALHTELSRS